MKFAYADPPYIGQAKKHYKNDPRCAEVNHKDLIDSLCDNYPDGWALSASSPSLREVLSYCPTDVRTMAWVKPFCSFKPGVPVAYAWEPVIFRGGRKRTRQQVTVRDWVSANITMKKGLCGAKPETFCYWLFEVFNIQIEDTLDDLYPGTGVVIKCLEKFKEKLVVPFVL